MDGVRRFPTNVPCVILDILNALYAYGTNKFVVMPAEQWAKVREMFVLMDRFRSRFYMCSAPASCFGLRSGFDVASARC
eukprot:10338856-Heterocapsa_arctica.AAC.1